MNLFLLLGAAGLSHSLFGERLLPIGTLYDPFISRGLDALNYACYQDARFLLVATPSGVSLAGEGGAHQSIATPLIGMAQDGLAAFEPAFADELSVIMDWAFDYMQRDGEARADLADWPRDVSGGSVYLRLSTRSIEQVPRRMDRRLADDIIRGGYWLKPPTPECEVVIAYQGVLASEAIAAAGALGGDRRNVAVLAVTSADRLNAGWHARAARPPPRRPRRHLPCRDPARRSAAPCRSRDAIDGHPATLGWLGSVHGHRAITLGVEHFGQTGSVSDLYRHFGIDAQAIVTALREPSRGRSRSIAINASIWRVQLVKPRPVCQTYVI